MFKGTLCSAWTYIRSQQDHMGKRGGGANTLLLSYTQPQTDGRMFWPAEAANGEQGAAPSIRAGPVRGSVWLNLKSVFTGWSSLLRALFFSLMVVQTLRMKIQESPVTCDMGRVSSGEVRGSDPDCDKTSCEDVPRLDLTALTEDNNWGALHMGVWVAAAHLLLSLFLLLLLLLMRLLLSLLQDLIVKDPLKFSSHLYLEEKHSLRDMLVCSGGKIRQRCRQFVLLHTTWDP
ncbi:hypothetical protein INR49_016992 [Caranx melampygus]|nr:hypothetical protein INR49_016992 [Caranx melampygus]